MQPRSAVYKHSAVYPHEPLKHRQIGNPAPPRWLSLEDLPYVLRDSWGLHFLRDLGGSTFGGNRLIGETRAGSTRQ